MAAVTVQELQEILKTTKAPRKLIDPVTELPLWDEKLMTIVRNAKSYQEIQSVDEELRKTMVSSFQKLQLTKRNSFSFFSGATSG